MVYLKVLRPGWVRTINDVIQIKIHLGVLQPGWDICLSKPTYQ